jgi:hypothetical protein
MSVEINENEIEKTYYTNEKESKKFIKSKVNLTDLMNRLKLEKKKERQSNLVFSTAAVSAVAAICVFLTL